MTNSNPNDDFLDQLGEDPAPRKKEDFKKSKRVLNDKIGALFDTTPGEKRRSITFAFKDSLIDDIDRVVINTVKNGKKISRSAFVEKIIEDAIYKK